jgi:uncharacterized membrane protein
MARQRPSDSDLPTRDVDREPGASASTRAGAAAVAGACVGTLASLLGTWQLGILTGWDVIAIVYVVWTWGTIWPRDPGATARLAVREDPGRATADALVLLASVASLLAVALVITAGSSSGSGASDARAALAVASVVLSWSVVHTVFTARYARLYYTGPDGGIDFNQQTPPRYADFAYVAFTVGMTFQVSDTDLETPEIRVTALRHALLSYLFGAVILATTINLVAGLLNK